MPISFHSLLGALLSAAVLFCALSPEAHAQSPETVYYWIAPNFFRPTPTESFVIAVDRTTAAQIEAIIMDGGRAGFGGRIASGSISYNKNYFAPGHPVWNWHVTSVETIFDFRNAVFAACECPGLVANPSQIAANPEEWIRRNGNKYGPEYYEIRRRIDPAKRDAMANVSSQALFAQPA